MTQTKVSDYQILDHGIETSQYFQGCGVAFSRFTDVVTGCGNDYAEALDDALESMAQNNIDVESFDDEVANAKNHEIESVPPDAEDCYYYVSIRYSLAD